MAAACCQLHAHTCTSIIYNHHQHQSHHHPHKHHSHPPYESASPLASSSESTHSFKSGPPPTSVEQKTLCGYLLSHPSQWAFRVGWLVAWKSGWTEDIWSGGGAAPGLRLCSPCTTKQGPRTSCLLSWCRRTSSPTMLLVLPPVLSPPSLISLYSSLLWFGWGNLLRS